MPYYDETRASATPGWYGSSGVPATVETSSMRTFRSQPSPLSLTSSEVSAHLADPYAYFLDNISRKAYLARLNERGLPAMGSPDRGHPVTLKRHKVVSKLLDITEQRVGSPAYLIKGALLGPYANVGDAMSTVHNGTFSRFPTNFYSGLEAFAQQAYNRTAPTSVVFDAAQFLGELREGLPSMIFAGLVANNRTLKNRGFLKDVENALLTRSRHFKSLGGEYLNVEFGWKPFLSDLQNAGRALYKATQMLAQQGQRVHRTLELPPVSRYESVRYRNISFSPYVGIGSGVLTPLAITRLRELKGSTNDSASGITTYGGSGTLSKTISIKKRFVGEFSSFYPLGFDPSNYFDRLNQLVNVKLTPAVLWELTPWSWMVDWFFKIQSTITANEKAGNDLLVMHYGYATETVSFTTDYSYELNPSSIRPGTTLSGIPRYGSTIVKDDLIRRIRANPFGFKSGGYEGLSGPQIAILAALGLTKVKR